VRIETGVSHRHRNICRLLVTPGARNAGVLSPQREACAVMREEKFLPRDRGMARGTAVYHRLVELALVYVRMAGYARDLSSPDKLPCRLPVYLARQMAFCAGDCRVSAVERETRLLMIGNCESRGGEAVDVWQSSHLSPPPVESNCPACASLWQSEHFLNLTI